jgi:hypothetical protein
MPGILPETIFAGDGLSVPCPKPVKRHLLVSQGVALGWDWIAPLALEHPTLTKRWVS